MAAIFNEHKRMDHDYEISKHRVGKRLLDEYILNNFMSDFNDEQRTDPAQQDSDREMFGAGQLQMDDLYSAQYDDDMYADYDADDMYEDIDEEDEDMYDDYDYDYDDYDDDYDYLDSVYDEDIDADYGYGYNADGQYMENLLENYDDDEVYNELGYTISALQGEYDANELKQFNKKLANYIQNYQYLQQELSNFYYNQVNQRFAASRGYEDDYGSGNLYDWTYAGYAAWEPEEPQGDGNGEDAQADEPEQSGSSQKANDEAVKEAQKEVQEEEKKKVKAKTKAAMTAKLKKEEAEEDKQAKKADEKQKEEMSKGDKDPTKEDEEESTDSTKRVESNQDI
eukprot:CAMPEP_0197036736 /NCGR_PEP_ID=MMETSP1384-20130603/14146_1 /TAXON_ID=29189 /ORGANISM="Ammonia sp." /LENGTH=338 /DNA_ID=CAMNT_0042466943 /DNA_START=1196 /DNA_END=2212 /DNA_ORIENTATION=+